MSRNMQNIQVANQNVSKRKLLLPLGTGVWWCTQVIPRVQKLRQVDCCELQASLCYAVISVLAWDTQQDSALETKAKTRRVRQLFRPFGVSPTNNKTKQTQPYRKLSELWSNRNSFIHGWWKCKIAWPVCRTVWYLEFQVFIF